MSGSVEDKVVAMHFDNKQFEPGVKTSLATLDKLKSSLKFDGATSGLDGVQSKLNGFSTGGMTGAVQGLSNAWVGMATVAVTAIANITTKAVDAGLQLAKSLTIAPIMDGFHEYETTIGSIQTILSNTRDQGTNLKDVNKALNELNHYSDKTIYNFTEMAKNIGTFTAAGVDLKTSVESIKGIANLAALSGSNSQQASTAMYQLSQAISAGRVGLQDWNSVVNAGMGGAIFQKALANTAVAMGDINKNAVKLVGPMHKLEVNGGSFRNSIMAAPGQTSWLTGDVLTNTLKQLSGNLNKNQIMAQGFTEAQAKAILVQGKLAQDAATKVKTLTQLMGTLREAVGSGWTKTFQNIFGNFNQARTLFTDASNYFGKFIGQSAKARNMVLKQWSSGGGRDLFIDSLKQGFHDLLRILGPVTRAFRDIFPRKTGADLISITRSFDNFMKALRPSQRTMSHLRVIFRALFGIISIGLDVVKGIIYYFTSFFGLFAGKNGTGSILGFVAGIAKMINKFVEWEKKGAFIPHFFDALVQARKNILGPLIKTLSILVQGIHALVTGNVDVFGKRMEQAFKSLPKIFDGLRKNLYQLLKTFGVSRKEANAFFSTLANKAQDAYKVVSAVFQQLSSKIAEFFRPFTKNVSTGADIAKGIVDGLIQGLDVTALRKAVENVANNIIVWIKNVLGIHSPATTMVPVGQNVILGIVKGLNTAGVWLNKALRSILSATFKGFTAWVGSLNFTSVVSVIHAGLFVAIVLAFRKFLGQFSQILSNIKNLTGGAGDLLNQLTGNLKTMQSKVRSEIIRNIAISVGILAVSALLLSKVDGKKLGISLAAIAGMMTTLLGVMYALGGGGKGKHIDNKAIGRQTAQMFAMSTALIAFATAVLIMTAAVALMGQLKPETIKKGLAGVSGVIAIIVAATAVLGRTGGGATIIASAFAMTIMAVALTEFVGVMKLYESLDFKTLIRGGGAAAAVIAALGISMRAFSKGAIGGSVSLVIASGGLLILARALKQLSKIGVGNLVKSIVAVDVILGSLAVAAEAMSAAEGGAGSMVIMAGSLLILAKVLQVLAVIPFFDLVKGLAAITVAILVISATSAGLSALSPLVAALGASLLIVGGALFLAGAGVFAFATAMAILASSGTAGFAVMKAGIDMFIKELPKLGRAFGGFLVSVIQGFVEAAVPLAKAVGHLVITIINQLIKIVPRGGRLMVVLIDTMLAVARATTPNWIKTGIHMILSFLDGIRRNADAIVHAAVLVVGALLRAVLHEGEKLLGAGKKVLKQFISGIVNNVKDQIGILRDNAKTLAGGFVSGMVQGIKDGLGAVGDAASALAHHALDIVKNPLHWHVNSPSRATRKLGAGFGEGAALGIKDQHAEVEKQAGDMAHKALDAIHMTFSKSKAMTDGLKDLQPKITPILDLTQLERDATQISGKMGSHTIKTDLSRHHAKDIAAAHAARHGSGAHNNGGDTYEFIQNIHSPQPVNHVKAYRGTKSQIALFREVTGK